MIVCEVSWAILVKDNPNCPQPPKKIIQKSNLFENGCKKLTN
jgi:hypothetical protein